MNVRRFGLLIAVLLLILGVVPLSAAAADGTGSISGTVRDPSGNPIVGVSVTALLPDLSVVQFRSTGADGTYLIDGLPAGDSWTVYFSDPSGGYTAEWYDDAEDQGSATAVSVIAGSSTSGIDAVLAAAGGITGRVTDGAGDPIDGVSVSAWLPGSSVSASQGTTEADGTYSVGGLSTANYVLQFSALDGLHQTEWYDDAADMGSATAVSVTAGSIVSGINAVLADAGMVAGHVTDVDGNPLQGITVWVSDPMITSTVGQASTGSDGAYSVGALAEGSYAVRFYDSSGTYTEELYDDQPWWERDTATLVTVTAGSVSSGIDAVMAETGSITGRVTDGTNGIGNIEVTAYMLQSSASDLPIGDAYTNANGTYTIAGPPGLIAGDYQVRFRDPSGVFAEEWYATPVTVVPGVATSGVDAVLAQETSSTGSISGTVTEEGTGTPISSIVVWAYDLSGDWVDYVSPSSDGTYSIGGLAPGDYKVEFTDRAMKLGDEPSGIYIDEWYDDAANFDSADTISVVAGATTTVNAQLTVGGSITGQVTAEGTGQPLIVEVLAVPVDSIFAAESSWTLADGSYSIDGLPTGDYQVKFRENEGLATLQGYLAEWYNDRPERASADIVSVTAGSTTAGIDAALALKGSTPPPPGGGGGGTTTTTVPDAGFVDVSSGSVFFDDINYIAYYGVTTGVGGGRFDPLGEVSRWQMALFLDRVWEAVGFSLPAPSGSLTDIGDLPAEYQDAIGALAALGVTQGTGDGRFNPDGEVSRWQMALFLVRVLDLAGVTLPSGANQGFSDIGSLDVSYQMAINQLFQLGITTGTSASTFGPDGVVTREQMAAFLARTMRLIQLIQQ